MDLFWELKNILNVISVVEIRSLFQQMTYKRSFGGDTFILEETVPWQQCPLPVTIVKS